jgi:hypothetical protein
MKLIPSFESQGLKQIFQLAIIIWLIEVLLVIITWTFLPPQLPLFYSRPWGEEQLVHPANLFILPGLGLLVFFVNLFVLSFVPKGEKLINQILISIILVFNFLSLITLIQIIRLAI